MFRVNICAIEVIAIVSVYLVLIFKRQSNEENISCSTGVARELTLLHHRMCLIWEKGRCTRELTCFMTFVTNSLDHVTLNVVVFHNDIIF